jgi:hypothetical protein
MPALKSFNPSTAVNLGTNTINIPTHGLIVGQGVLYSNGGGTSISGLVDGYKYYVIFVDINNIRLANTEVEARAGTAVDLLSSGSGTTHTLTTTNIYPNSAAYYDFFRKFRFIGTLAYLFIVTSFAILDIILLIFFFCSSSVEPDIEFKTIFKYLSFSFDSESKQFG